MRHNRQEVIRRTIQEFELLDHLVANLTNEPWNRPVPRFELKDPWTVIPLIIASKILKRLWRMIQPGGTKDWFSFRLLAVG